MIIPTTKLDEAEDAKGNAFLRDILFILLAEIISEILRSYYIIFSMMEIRTYT